MNTKPKRRRMSADEIRRAVELYDAGGTFRAIGQALGWSACAIRHNIRGRTTLRVCRTNRPRRTLMACDIKRAAELFSEGKRIEAIARGIGCTGNAVRYHLKKIGALGRLSA